MLSSLPVQKPEELVLVTSPGEFKDGRSSSDDSGGMDYIFSYPVFRALEKNSQALAGLAAFRHLGANLSFGKQTVPGSFDVVSGQYFPTARRAAADRPHDHAGGRRRAGRRQPGRGARLRLLAR